MNFFQKKVKVFFNQADSLDMKLNKVAFSGFTRKYNLSKTLKFELKPVGDTKNHLQEFIDSDTIRAKEYIELKQIIDDYHKHYIEKSLSASDILDDQKLKELSEAWSEVKKLQLYEDKKKKEGKIDKLKKELRKQLVSQFKNQKELFGKELITKILPDWLNEGNVEDAEHKKKIVENFKTFTTYLTGFHENRKNMYSDEEQSTAISHRSIDTNFYRFSSNKSVYKKISEKYKELEKDLENVKTDMKEEFEALNIKDVQSLFEESFFNKCLTQTGIDSYNVIIGGKTLDNNKNIKGINQRINLYRQKKRKEKVKISNANLPLMQPLYKQILTERESHSFYDKKEFENRGDVLEALKNLWEEFYNKEDENQNNVLKNIENLLMSLSDSNQQLDKIYFKRNSLSSFSNSFFKDYRVVQDALRFYSEKSLSSKKERENWLKKDFFSFEEVNVAIKMYQEEQNNKLDKLSEASLQSYLASELKYLLNFGKLRDREQVKEDKFSLEELYKKVMSLPKDSQSEFKKEETELIQGFLQYFMDFLHLAKPLFLEHDKEKTHTLDRDSVFYLEFEELYTKLSDCISVYNKTRNYITQNKNRLKKVKINFEDNTLLNGWDVNKESDNLSVILRKKEKDKWMYYLAVMNKKHNKIFDYHLNIDDKDNEKSKSKKTSLEKEITGTDKDVCYEKINYKFLADPSKMLPKVFFSKKRKGYFNPSDKIQKIIEQKTYTKGDKFKLEDCHELINFYKASLEKHYDWKKFEFKFSDTNKYKDISDFYHEVSSQGYKLSFDKIKSSYISEKVKKGNLYLFKIYNKDFSEYSKGKPNLHTSYFRLLFEKDNLKDTVFKLNGQAEIFYRKATKNRKVTHKANEPIDRKKLKNPGKSQFVYDLIKDKRFTEDKYFFHVPIALNFKEKGLSVSQFNQDALQWIKSNKDINVIGIDRGEKHLAYYTVLNPSGEILEQGSFNDIVSNYQVKGKEAIQVKTTYHELLERREKERDKSRKSWNTVESIKELKSGYLSYLVHKISELMLKYNAVVVLEDLNMGFKRGRMKFEKQVYQKLEKALIDKLNYLVFKDKSNEESGGFLKAYQLTAPFESFQKLRKQTGFLFYVPAYHTSKVDPLTGFVNLIYPRYENIKKSQNFFETFNKIYFNEKEDYFVFEYSDAKVNSESKNKSKAIWKVCTHSPDRYRYVKKDKTHEKVNISQEMKALFKEYDIEHKSEECIKDKIVKQNKSEFFKKLLHLLNLTVQLRHINPKGKTSDEKDFILSPVADKKGRFFDSRKANDKEPKNADANGAYHIALKGLMNLTSIKPPDKNNKLQVPKIKNEDWLKYIREAKLNKKVSKAG